MVTLIRHGRDLPKCRFWDLVLGRNYGGEAFGSINLTRYISGAGYQFSDGGIAGSFPRNGLVWSFDFLDQGLNSSLTNWPFVDRGTNSAATTPCDIGYAVTATCGYMNSGHGISMNAYGIQTYGNARVTAVISIPRPSARHLERSKTLQTRCRVTDRIRWSESTGMRADVVRSPRRDLVYGRGIDRRQHDD